MGNRNVENTLGDVFVPGAAPGSPTEGQVYYDSTDHVLKFRTDIGWVNAGAGSGGTSMGSFGSSPNANGGTIAAGVLYLQPADGMYPGGVTATAQTFNGVKTFAAIVSPAVYNTNGTGASDVCVKTGSSVADASVNGTAELLRVSTGIGGTEVPYLRVTKYYTYVDNLQAVGTAGVVATSGLFWTASSVPACLFSNLGGSSSVCTKLGSSLADSYVDTATKMFSVRSGIAGTEVEYVSATKAGIRVSSSEWLTHTGNDTYSGAILGTNGMVSRTGDDTVDFANAQTSDYSVGNSGVMAGDTSTLLYTDHATTDCNILITWLGDHGAARSWVTRAAGSFTVHLSSAAQADTPFSWMITKLLPAWYST